MRKELLLAVFVGSILGLLVAFGIWRANSAIGLKGDTTSLSNQNRTASPSPASSNKQNDGLTIVKPENEEVITQADTQIEGLAKANSWIIVTSDTFDTLAKTDTSGSFSTKATLIGGLNTLSIASLDNSGAITAENIALVHSTEVGTPPSAASESTSSDSIRQIIQNKIDLASNKPKALLGTVTDKTETGFQLRSSSGEIKQSSVATAETTFIRLGRTNRQTDFADLGIGDYAIAIGYLNATGVLDSRRVLITTTPQSSQKKIFLGTVTENARRQVTFSYGDNNQATFVSSPFDLFSVSSDMQLKDVGFSTLSPQDKIIVIGTQDQSKITPTTVYIVEDSAPPTPTPRTR